MPGLPRAWTAFEVAQGGPAAHTRLDAGERMPAPTAPWKTGQRTPVFHNRQQAATPEKSSQAATHVLARKRQRRSRQSPSSPLGPVEAMDGFDVAHGGLPSTAPTGLPTTDRGRHITDYGPQVSTTAMNCGKHLPEGGLKPNSRRTRQTRLVVSVAPLRQLSAFARIHWPPSSEYASQREAAARRKKARR